MRLFIAIQFEEKVLDALSDFQDDLKAQGVTGNYTKRENLHITLAFVGEYGNPDDVLEAMEQVDFRPLDIALDTVGIISKITPMTEKENKRRSVYEVTDSMYRFWYSFVPGARAAIEMNRDEVYYKNYVKDKIHSFMGKVFEDMCRYYTLSQGLDGKLNCLVVNVGSWWGPGHDHIPTDIDVVGIKYRRVAAFPAWLPVILYFIKLFCVHNKNVLR